MRYYDVEPNDNLPRSRATAPTDDYSGVEEVQTIEAKADAAAPLLGQHLYELRQMTRATKGHFDGLCQAIGIPRSTAYFKIQ